MIFSIKQERHINKIIEQLLENSSKVEWVLKEEDIKYCNTVYENLTICLGHGKLDHLQNNNTENETYHYYSSKNQLDYFISIFKHDKNDLAVVVYECNNGQLDGSHKLSAEIIEF